MRTITTKDGKELTEYERKLYLFLCKYAFKVQEMSGCHTIGVEKDYVLEQLNNLEKII